MVIEGIVAKEKYAYQRITKIKPIAHHYEENGEIPYIKYGCPICEALGNRFTLTNNIKNCPLCNVNLYWEKESS